MMFFLKKHLTKSKLYVMIIAISMKSITCIKIKKGLIFMKQKKNTYIGICTVGEKGQIVIPKPARDMFDIQSGDSVVVLCDKKKGIALVKADVMQGFADKILGQNQEEN